MELAHILVRSVNWLGDAVMSTPALTRLREGFPQARLSLLAPAGLADLWRHHPGVDQLLTFERGESPFRVARRLRRYGFDGALILPNSPRSAGEAFLAGIPRRIGYRRRWRSWLLTDAVSPRPGEVSMRKRSVGEIRRRLREPAAWSPPHYSPDAHHIYQYLHLVAALGVEASPCAPSLRVTREEVESFQAERLAETPPPPCWLGLNPGAAYGPAKRWDADNFVSAARVAHAACGCGCLVTGSTGEGELARHLADRLQAAGVGPVVNLAGRTTLRELCLALKSCRALLTNDSGPMHLAAALGTPVAAIFGSTAPELTGPGDPCQPSPHMVLRHPVPCSPCFRRECPVDRRCLAGVSAERAGQALEQLLQGHSSAARPEEP